MKATPRDGLYETCLAQWQAADWLALHELDSAALQLHPHRAHIALMACSACHQLDAQDDARRWAGLARDWGAAETDLARLLIGGAQHSLGRAAAALGDGRQAVRHLRESLELTAPVTGAAVSSLPLRLARTWADLGATPVGTAPDTEDADAVDEAARLRPWLAAAAQAQAGDWRALQKRLSRDLKETRSAIEATVRLESGNVARQVEAFLGIWQLLQTGQTLPPLHGWAVSADFAHELLQRVLNGGYDAVVEFGSGTSTVLIAKAAQRLHTQDAGALPSVLSFDHLEPYHAATQARLREAGVDALARVVLAPLTPYTATDGVIYPFYDRCSEELATLREHGASPPQSVLAVVDGPPAATGEHARYPALPLLVGTLAPYRIDLLLDDYRRGDEQEVVRLWLSELKANGYEASLTELDFEKRAAFVQAQRSPRPARAGHEPGLAP
jgi:hypothetical protein